MSHRARAAIALALSPVGLLIISAVRLLVISDYNATTATTIASSGGYVNTLLGTAIPLIPILMPYLALALLAAWRPILSSFAFIAAALISPTPITQKGFIARARAEGHLLASLTETHVDLIVLAGIIVIFAIWTGLVWEGASSLWAFSIRFAWAAVVLVILVPQLYNIYPPPRSVNYYETILRQPWIPAEAIKLKSGEIDYAYVVSNDSDWFTVLLVASRTIRYVKAEDILSRDVCQVAKDSIIARSSPLVPLLSTKPAHTPNCPNRDSSMLAQQPGTVPRTRAQNYLSHGESLNVISSAVHVSPNDILSETNAYQHQRLSASLRAYENEGDWDASTPVGQHFWYYPPMHK
jgi:hypothetical protein